MSELPHFTEASADLTKQFTKALDQTAVELGRKNERDNHVDWDEVNQRMAEWWKGQGFRFP